MTTLDVVPPPADDDGRVDLSVVTEAAWDHAGPDHVDSVETEWDREYARRWDRDPYRLKDDQRGRYLRALAEWHGMNIGPYGDPAPEAGERVQLMAAGTVRVEAHLHRGPCGLWLVGGSATARRVTAHYHMLPDAGEAWLTREAALGEVARWAAEYLRKSRCVRQARELDDLAAGMATSR